MRLWFTRTATTAAFQMQGVAVGWQLYEMTGNPIDLGIVGFIQFLPLVVLNLVVGQVTDRYDRRAIIRNCQVVKVLMVGLLALGTAMGWLTREWMFAFLLVASTARAFEMPVMQALLPSIVPVTAAAARDRRRRRPRSRPRSSRGPAIGGLLYLLGPVTVYATCAIICAAAAVLVSCIQLISDKQDKRPITLESVFAGFSFIWNRKVLLGVMSLDLFVVLVGGITALLPIFAKDILETGPWGLGLLRSAPAVGALTASVVLARWSIEAKAGKILFAERRGVRRLDRGVQPVDVARAVADRARRLRRRRRHQRRHPPFDGADPHADRDARPRHHGELDVHRLVRLARRIPRRADGGMARRGAGGAVRRRRRDRGHVHLDARVPGDRAHRQADVGGWQEVDGDPVTPDQHRHARRARSDGRVGGARGLESRSRRRRLLPCRRSRRASWSGGSTASRSAASRS